MRITHKPVLLIAAVSIFVISGHATTYAQNATVPRESPTEGADSPKPPSRGTRAIQILLGALTQIVCEEAGNCPQPITTPTETETPGFTRDSTPMSTVRRSKAVARDFSYHTPRGWRAYEDGSSVTVARPSEYVNGNLSNGVVFGLADLNGASFASGADKYVRDMLSANTYLKQVGSAETNSGTMVSCITKRFAGLSPQTAQTEDVVVHTCRRNAQKLLYVVSVTSGPNSSRHEDENNSVIQSLSFR
jgi:hypothetical protein